jgi:hypothetical protein
LSKQSVHLGESNSEMFPVGEDVMLPVSFLSSCSPRYLTSPRREVAHCNDIILQTRRFENSLELEELELFLRPTVSQPVCLGIGPPFGTLDQILSCSSFSSDNYFILRSKAPSLTRKRVCSLQCNHSLVRAVTPNKYTLPPHLRLCSLFVSSYDSQGLRWTYSNPPPHGDENN